MAVRLGDDIRRGDWIDGYGLSPQHGPVGDVQPYRCKDPHLKLPGVIGSARCDQATCERSRWQVIRFHDGTSITLSGTWPGATLTRPEPPAGT